MHLFINGLAARALSGWYVLRGHLSQLAKVPSPHRITLLIDESQTKQLAPIPDAIHCITLPQDLSSVIKRAVWERLNLKRLVREHRADALLSVSGSITGGLPIPEATLALNPWCMVHDIPKRRSEEIKAWLQRMAYRKAMREADAIFFCSTHLMSLYQANASGRVKSKLELVKIGLEPELYEVADRYRAEIDKVPGRIVSVSAMAPWKGADRLIQAMPQILQRVPEARLRLVGPWPHQGYEQECLELIDQLALKDKVTITGGVSREQLYREYAAAQVYALLSRAESFGIPALEAQAFGCPVLGATDCAMPEVGGAGGRYVEAYDILHAASEIAEMLGNASYWQDVHEKALANASAFTWEQISAPLVRYYF